MPHSKPYFLQHGNIYAVPIIHYNMEMAAQVKMAFDFLNPDCVAVELPETMHQTMLQAASRLPDISVIVSYRKDHSPLYVMCEPCDPCFEALRSASENGCHAYCIDLDVDDYPTLRDAIPDPYAIYPLGLKTYYELCEKHLFANQNHLKPHLDLCREQHMARRLKELSLRHERVLFISGMAHLSSILKALNQNTFPTHQHAERDVTQLCTLTPESCREVLAEWGFISTEYEKQRGSQTPQKIPDRQKIIFDLYKQASQLYIQNTGNPFPSYHLRNILKFVKNYACVGQQLVPDLFKILTAAKGCVDHHYAYEVWELATTYPYYRNVDNLPEIDLSVEDVWGAAKRIHFQFKQKGKKQENISRLRKDRSQFHFYPPNRFSICSYPPEDIAIEKFGKFLQKKGSQLLTEESARIIPFSTSIEDGIDTKETIRHWHEKTLYVKAKGKPPKGIGSVCIIFDEDQAEEGEKQQEKYNWQTTWLGEHDQESDMAFYATPLSKQVIGPGISRCEYGGFMMSYPPRRMQNVWTDPDYFNSRSKAEVLLMAAVDYAVKPVIVYVASKPPRTALKSYANRFGKKIVYLPIGQLSPVTLNKLRAFHVLDGHDKRKIADEYIF